MLRPLPWLLSASLFALPAPLLADTSSDSDLASQLQIDNPDYLQGLQRVVITSFSVQVLTELKASEGGDISNLISGKPNEVSVSMQGHDDKQWPAIVDGYYQTLLQQLQAAGIQVVSTEELQALPEYKTVRDAGKPSPQLEDAKAGKGMYYGVSAVPMLIQNEQQVFRKSLFSGQGPEDPYMTFGSRFASGFSTGAAQQAEFALARKLNAHALKVRFTVVPALLTTSKGFWTGTSVDSKAALSLPGYVNRFVLYSPNGDQSKISLKAAVASNTPVGEMKDTTSTAGTALRTANMVGGMALGFLTGGIAGALKSGGTVSRDYELTVDSKRFDTMLQQELGRVSAAFVTRLRQN